MTNSTANSFKANGSQTLDDEYAPVQVTIQFGHLAGFFCCPGRFLTNPWGIRPRLSALRRIFFRAESPELGIAQPPMRLEEARWLSVLSNIGSSSIWGSGDARFVALRYEHDSFHFLLRVPHGSRFPSLADYANGSILPSLEPPPSGCAISESSSPRVVQFFG